MSEEKAIICIWLDNKLIQCEEHVDVQIELRATAKDFQRFRDFDECLDFITDQDEQCRIFLITSMNIGKLLVPLVHLVEQIESIYLFCSSKTTDNNEWTQQYSKIKGIFLDVKLIYNRFLKDTSVRDHHKEEEVSISFLSSRDITSVDVNRQDPTFMYFQLLKEILLTDHSLENEDLSRKEMIDFCRETCANNPSDIVLLDEFEQTFIPEMSIFWYLKESFLFQMLNKALWSVELDVLYRFRYFLRHLYNQIVSEAEKQRSQLSSSIVVYRGQTMSDKQIERLKRNLGGFLSFNNFLSTSFKRQVALNFLLGSSNGVLFQIQIDPKIQRFPIVNIELISYLINDEDNEQELLFTMGSVFRILSIEKTPNYYLVELTLSEDVDEQLANYTIQMRNKVRTNHSFLSLLKLMDELSQSNYVDQFNQISKQDFSFVFNQPLLALIHQTFGSIYLSRGQAKEAFDHLNRSLRIPVNNSILTKTYNLLGAACLVFRAFKDAIEYSQLAEQCQSNATDPDISAIITANKQLAKAYEEQDEYFKSIQHLKRVEELQQGHFGQNDPSLIETFGLISSIYIKMEDFTQGFAYRQKTIELEAMTAELNPEVSADYSIKNGILFASQQQHQQALIYFNSALEIQQKYYLSDNPAIAKTCNHIAQTYVNLNQYQQAIEFYQRALEIEQNSLSSDHYLIPQSYHNIAKVYFAQSSWISALEYSQKAVEKLKTNSNRNTYLLAYYTSYIGLIYQQQKEYEIALISYEEAIQIFEFNQHEGDGIFLGVYFRTGQIYQHLRRYDHALKCFQKTLEIELKVLPENDVGIAETYSSLADVYFSLKQFDQAISFGEQTLQQLLKTLPTNNFKVFQQKLKLSAIKQKALLT